MANTGIVLHHLAELYAKPKTNQLQEAAICEYEEKLTGNFDSYDRAFSGIATAELVKAIDDYWRYKSDKQRPTVAQIMAMVNSTEHKAGGEMDEEFRARVEKCAAELDDKWGSFDSGIGARFKAKFGLED